MVDAAGRKHANTYALPVAGQWSGPTLLAGAANATASSTSLTEALRDGDYQIGHNAYPVAGYPAQISLYRDATFQLGFTHFFDNAKRLEHRSDRTALPIAATSIDVEPGPFWDDTRSWSPSTSGLFMNSLASAKPGGQESAAFTPNFDFDT